MRHTTDFACNPLLILGAGNILMADDGVGVHAARALQQAPPVGATVVDAGAAATDVLDLFQSAAHVLVLDAVQGGRPPGTIYRFELPQPACASLYPRAARALHETGLRAALGRMAAARRTPITVLGVEPASCDYGAPLSRAVQRVFLGYLTEIRRWTARSVGPRAFSLSA